MNLVIGIDPGSAETGMAFRVVGSERTHYGVIKRRGRSVEKSRVARELLELLNQLKEKHGNLVVIAAIELPSKSANNNRSPRREAHLWYRWLKNIDGSIEIVFVRPHDWQERLPRASRETGLDLSTPKKELKARSIQAAERVLGIQVWQDDIADAVNIMQYGFERYCRHKSVDPDHGQLLRD